MFLRYAEEKDYDYDTGAVKTESKGKAIGHFTQVVWKASIKLGIGKATGKVVDDKGISWFCTWVVGRYSPPGNYRGQYQENVLKP